MDSASQTSFIPKKPITAPSYSYENRGISIVTIICIILFLGTVALAAGSYMYKNFYLEKELTNVTDKLNKIKSTFEVDTIKYLKRLDIRLSSAKTLLDQHIAVSAYFDILEVATLKSVRFSSLTITARNGSSVGGAPVLSSASLTRMLSLISPMIFCFIF